MNSPIISVSHIVGGDDKKSHVVTVNMQTGKYAIKLSMPSRQARQVAAELLLHAEIVEGERKK